MEKSDLEFARSERINTFSVPFLIEEFNENLSITTNTPSKSSKEQIINQAIKFHLQGNISEATKYYQYCLNEGVKDTRVFSNYGTILKDLGKLEKAALLTRKAIELNPALAEAHSNLGNILRDLGDLEEAEISTRKAIDLKTDFAIAHSTLGMILNDLGKLKEAENSIQKAIELRPGFAMAYFNKGIILQKLKRYNEAIASFIKASNLAPENPIYYAKRGLKRSDFFRETLTKNNNLIKSLNNGDWVESEKSLKEACIKEPKYTKANVNEFIKLWCVNIKKLVDQGSPYKLLPILTNLLIINERNEDINDLMKYVFQSFDLNSILELVGKTEKMLFTLSYCDYKFLKKEFSEIEVLASNYIKEAEILIREKKTEDLGWLITRRSLVLFNKKNLARNNLTSLINNLIN